MTHNVLNRDPKDGDSGGEGGGFQESEDEAFEDEEWGFQLELVYDSLAALFRLRERWVTFEGVAE
eukprot:4179163-Lingulodinium_polyedra.AAC.1